MRPMIGLKVAMQFVKLATRYADEGNTEAATRNFRAAQNSYQDFLKFLRNATLTPSQREQVEKDRTQVKSNLDVLKTRLKTDS